MWDLPGPGLEPVSPALAGEFLTTVPPGKPTIYFLNIGVFNLWGIGLITKTFPVAYALVCITFTNLDSLTSFLGHNLFPLNSNIAFKFE